MRLFGYSQGNLRGEYVAAAILPSRIEQSYCTSGLSKPAKQARVAFPACTESCAHIGYRAMNHAVTIMRPDRAN